MINAATNEIEKEEVMVGARVVVKECVKKEIWDSDWRETSV